MFHNSVSNSVVSVNFRRREAVVKLEPAEREMGIVQTLRWKTFAHHSIFVRWHRRTDGVQARLPGALRWPWAKARPPASNPPKGDFAR